MSQTERFLPRGEITARVRRELDRGVVSYHQISANAEIPTAQVVHAVSEFQRKKGHKPDDYTRALRQHEHDEAHSQSRGGLWQIIRPYAHLGMWPGEIKAVVKMVDGIELNRTNIKNTLVRKRRKTYISTSPPKKGDSGKVIDTKLLLLWLDTTAILADKIDLKNMARTREQWLGLIHSLVEIGAITPTLDRWNETRSTWIKKCKEKEIEVLRRKISAERAGREQGEY